MNKLQQRLRDPQVWGFFLSIAVMAIISVAFFYPDAMEGNSLRQYDMQQGAAIGHEGQVYNEATGEKALWTNSLFSGMPTFQISPSYPSNNLFEWINSVYGLWLPSPSNLLFMMMFGFLIMLYCLRMRWYYALIGAVAWGLSSYFVIIIGAGHIWKFLALTYIPPTIGGMALCYRRRYLTGAAILALFAMMQLNANHPQMTYYFAFVMAGLAIAYLVKAIKGRTVRQWAVATAVCLGAGALAIGANLPSLYNTYEYSKETKRSASELTPLPSRGGDESPADAPTGGLPKSDIVAWSYGRSESLSLLIPNIKGGATARPEQGQQTYMSLDKLPGASGQILSQPQAQLLSYLPQYFNNSEGTNGPVYVGAIVCALFLLGCIVVKGPVKWTLVALTALSVLLAWGRNLEWLTDLMIYHFPLYSKFRAVESILVIAEFTVPLLGIMGLRRYITATPEERRAFRRPLMVAFGIPAAVCLAAFIVPSLFGAAITDADADTAASLQQQVVDMGRQYGMSQPEIESYMYGFSLSNPENVKAIESLRYGMVKADGLRSLCFVLLGFAALWGYAAGRVRRGLTLAVIGAGILIDLYGVDKRYVSHSSFCPAELTASDPFTPDEIDKLILADTDPSYRVMDIPGFALPTRSYHHKMVGGYHAAKLNRYEDLIQRRLSPVLGYGYNPELRDDSLAALYPPEAADAIASLKRSYRVLDMLNTRYIITGDKDAPLLYNTHALGNAWMVDTVMYVDGADAEMEALGTVDPARVAVADRRFADVLGQGSRAEGDSIRLTSYTPNRLTYTVDSKSGGVGVFSEVWFPWGWKAAIDGKPAELGRVNYVLRAMAIPAGRHEVTMTFDPDSLHVTGNVAYACVTIIYLLLICSLFVEVLKCVRPKK